MAGGPGFESRSDHYLDLFLGSPEFISSAALVNSGLPSAVMLIYNICFSVSMNSKAPSREWSSPYVKGGVKC